MAFMGRIAGVSGIAARLLPPYNDSALVAEWRFIVGLIATPLFMQLATGHVPSKPFKRAECF
jgi:hypothetical protein